MSNLTLSFVCLACFLFSMNSSTRAEKRYSEDFFKSLNNVSGKKLKMDNNNGGISVVGWDKDQIEIKAKKEISSEKYDIPQEMKDKMKEVTIDIKEEENSIEIETIYPKDFFRPKKLWNQGKYQVRVSFEIYVPRKTDIKLETLNGGLEIEGIDGIIYGRTLNGEITLRQSEGDMDISTTNGGISFKDIFGKCDIGSLNGGIDGEYTLLEKPIDLKLKSMNGEVSIKLPKDEGIEIFARCMMGSVSSDIPLVKSKSEFKGDKRIVIEVGNGSIGINKK